MQVIKKSSAIIAIVVLIALTITIAIGFGFGLHLLILAVSAMLAQAAIAGWLATVALGVVWVLGSVFGLAGMTTIGTYVGIKSVQLYKWAFNRSPVEAAKEKVKEAAESVAASAEGVAASAA